MLIHVISDTTARLVCVRTILERKHAVTSELLGAVVGLVWLLRTRKHVRV